MDRQSPRPLGVQAVTRVSPYPWITGGRGVGVIARTAGQRTSGGRAFCFVDIQAIATSPKPQRIAARTNGSCHHFTGYPLAFRHSAIIRKFLKTAARFCLKCWAVLTTFGTIETNIVWAFGAWGSSHLVIVLFATGPSHTGSFTEIGAQGQSPHCCRPTLVDTWASKKEISSPSCSYCTGIPRPADHCGIIASQSIAMAVEPPSRTHPTSRREKSIGLSDGSLSGAQAAKAGVPTRKLSTTDQLMNSR